MMRKKDDQGKQQSRRRDRIAVLLTAALLLAPKMPLQAVESERDNSLRSVRVAEDRIRESTLVIGSYLIDLTGLSDHIYEIAKDSAGEFSQSKMYYKSELAGGQWFEITEAVSLSDITNAGTPVSASVIEALAFTHQVAADGTVTDLRAQAVVNEFDIPDPYDLTEMEELLPIKMHWQYLQSKETKTQSDEKYLEIIEIFYGLSIEDDVTRDCDASLDALHPYKLELIARDKPASWTEAVTAVMEGEDARRRVQSLDTLDTYLDELLKKAGGQDQEGLRPEEIEAFYETLKRQNGETFEKYDINVGINDGSVENSDNNVDNADSGDLNTEEGETQAETWRRMRESYQKFLADAGTYRSVVLEEDFQVDPEMISAIGEAKSNVKTSIGKYTGKLLAQGTAASTQAIFRYSRELIEGARAHDTQGSDLAAGRLANLGNILKSVIEDADSERDTLEEELAEQALMAWQEILSGGVGGAYQQAAGEGAGEPALTAFLAQRETEAESARLEYQTMLTEMWKRMSNSPAQIDVGERIDHIGQLQALPSADAAQNRLLQTVDRHLEWLRESLAGLIADAGDSSALDRLVKAQSDLERQRLDALDENDLAEAKRLAAEMEAGQNDINDLRQDLYHVLTNPVSSAADKARAAAGMTEGSAGKVIGELAGNINAAILNGGEGDGLSNDLAALTKLASYDPDAASAAVSEIREVLEGAEADLAEEIGAQIADIERKADGIGGGRLSGEQLNGLLEEYFDESKAVSDQERTGALIALSRYADDTHNEAARTLAVSMANRFAAKGSPYLYKKYGKAADAYLSLQTVGRILDYRYLFDDAHHVVTLQKQSAYYIFTSGDSAYSFTEGAAGTLSTEAVMQSALYIDSGDGKQIFGCQGHYLSGCSYAAASTAEMEPVIEEVYNRLVSAPSQKERRYGR